jgi:hypothetical protein
LLGGSFFFPTGFKVGSFWWQPVFFGSICAVLGVCGLLVGALLAVESPTASAHVRRRFSWFLSHRFRHRLRTTGFFLMSGGFLLDTFLSGRWLKDPTLHSQLQLAATAQVSITVGAITTAFALIYETLRPESVSRNSDDGCNDEASVASAA